MSIITKWGNSLAVRIPKHITEALDLKDKDEVSIELKDNKIEVAAIAKKKKYTLDELLAGASADDFEGNSPAKNTGRALDYKNKGGFGAINCNQAV